MNKAELIEAIAKNCKVPKTTTKAVLDAMIEEVSKSLKKGQPVQLIGFGTFKVSDRKAREGRNPGTGEVIKIPAKKVPVFTTGAALKDIVAKKKK